MLNDQPGTDHFDVDRHRPPVVGGGGVAGRLVVGRGAALVFLVRQVAQPVRDVDGFERRVDGGGLRRGRQDCVGEDFVLCHSADPLRDWVWSAQENPRQRRRKPPPSRSPAWSRRATTASWSQRSPSTTSASNSCCRASTSTCCGVGGPYGTARVTIIAAQPICE